MSQPVNLSPAEAEPPTLLEQLQQRLADRDLCDAAINRTTPPPERGEGHAATARHDQSSSARG